MIWDELSLFSHRKMVNRLLEVPRTRKGKIGGYYAFTMRVRLGFYKYEVLQSPSCHSKE